MDRRDFLKTTSAAAIMAAGALAPAATSAAVGSPAAPAISVRRLKFAMAWPDNGVGLGDSGRRLACRISELTERRIVIEHVDAAARASADLYFDTDHSRIDRHPAFAYFAGLPGSSALPPGDLVGWLTVGGGEALWDDLARPLGVKPLLAAHAGVRPIVWSKRPIATLEDIADLRLFVRGLTRDVARGLGAEAVVMPEAELASRLAAGVIEAADGGDALRSSVTGIAANAPHGMAGCFGTAGSTVALNVTLSVWESLAEGERSAIRAATRDEFRTSMAEARTLDVIFRDILHQRHGATIASATLQLRATVDRIAEATIAHVAGYDGMSRRIDTSYTAWRRAAAGTTPVV